MKTLSLTPNAVGRSEEFWRWFDVVAAPKLSESKVFPRERTFRKMFEHLDRLDRPVHIVETGCIEDPDNWVGNGCSTIMFAKYVETHPGSKARSIEIIRDKLRRAQELCGAHVHFYLGDSVETLRELAGWAAPVDLLYLDASHHDWIAEAPSQAHHLAELLAIMPALHGRSLVVVDDSVIAQDDYPQAKVIGKGGLVSQYALEVGADMEFCEYQVGFTGITAKPPNDIDDIEGLIMRARSHAEVGRTIAADRLYRLVMIATPPPWSGKARIARGEACANFARNALHMKKFGSAIDWYRLALEVDPRATDYRLEMIRALGQLGALQAARREASIATALDPQNPAAWATLGGTESDLLNADACREAYDKEVEAASYAEDLDALSSAMLNRATIALDTADYDKVREACSAIHMMDRRRGDAFHVEAMLAYRLSDHERAIDLFDEAIAHGASNQPLVHWNKSLPLHSIGRLREGWAEHNRGGREERTVQAIYIPHHRFTRPLWDGEGPEFADDVGVTGKYAGELVKLRRTVLHVHTEAGHGDNISMLRYLPMLVERGYVVSYECDPALVSLAARSLPGVEVVPRALDYPGALGLKPFDYHLPIGDLPHAFGTDIDTVPWNGPYLTPEPAQVSKFAARLADLQPGRLKVGLCWSSGIRRNMNIWMERYGESKSMHFNDVKPIIFGNPDCTFVSLQVGPERSQRSPVVVDLMTDQPTWDETAAIVANLDLVITVDTAVAHLAGAMGKPTWVLMQRDGASWHFMCWRPGASWNESSPWYPATKLFRKHAFDGDWSGAVIDASRELIGWTG